MVTSLSDVSLSSLNSWLQWVAIGCSALVLLSTLGLVFVRTETDRRDQQKRAEAQAKIAELEEKTRPLTTPEKLLRFADSIDPTLRVSLQSGESIFHLSLLSHDFGVLRAIAQEDTEVRIKIHTSTNTVVGPEGSIIQVTLMVDPKMFQK